MGFEYALVHIKYNLPPAVLLSYLYRPFLSRTDVYKIACLIAIAVIATTPWDSYLIRQKVWSYPASVILGPTLFSIPAEELFFFVIQTYNTSLVYLILSKPVFHSAYLVGRKNRNAPHAFGAQRNAGQVIITLSVLVGGFLIWNGGRGTYLGLILAWAGSFALLIWSLAYQFLAGLPFGSTVLPIVLPTFYLWIVDTIALRRGTWVIESGTKLGIHVWKGLEMEEAIFFLATNTLIVFGLVAFDNALAIISTFPQLFPESPELPSPKLLVEAILTDTTKYNVARIMGMQQAVRRLQKKSRSFYLASAAFSGRLRIDLILLYSFCRVADDLVDNARTESEAAEWISKITQYLDLAYASEEARIISKGPDLESYIMENFPTSSRSALHLLPTHLLPYGPLYDLLEGFKTDSGFQTRGCSRDRQHFPIQNEHDLDIYATRVASTIAELCLALVFHYSASVTLVKEREHLVRFGGKMGMALQYVNISRDITTDSRIGRVYIPTTWLKQMNLTPQDVIKHPEGPEIEVLREKLLKKAFESYRKAKGALQKLPNEARGPMRVAVESYMEIGRVLREKEYRVKEGKATVPRMRRIRVAWQSLSEG